MFRSLTCLPAAALLAILAGGQPIQADEPQINEPTADQVTFFETNVRPLLADRCQDCHSGEEPESGLNLESRAGLLRGGELGPAIVPGQPRESLLISVINHDVFIKMPPKEKLATAELANLTRWVEMGAPWPGESQHRDAPIDVLQPTGDLSGNKSQSATGDATPEFTDEDRNYWAFQPPARHELPPVKNPHWTRSPIDYFVLAKLEAAGLAPAPPADKETLIRRATYDLLGLPPEPDDIAAFLRDTSDDAFATVIDRLLASPHYGERWGRHWLDVARYADSNGLDENLAYANAFHYRDYVIGAFNADKPYDRFVQEQIAGDLLDNSPNDDLERYVATGFLAIGAKMLAEDDPVKMQMDIIDEQVSTLCQAFLGMTMGCARCHDHKFDPLPTKDYYALAGIFKSSKTMENHKVVAQWYERPLLDAATVARIAAIDREVAARQQAIDALQAAVKERAKSLIRGQVAEYLLATVALDQFDQQSGEELVAPQADTQRPHNVTNGQALIEAEAFQRGNVERTHEGYGEGIGVVLSRGAGFLEYDLQVTAAGTYDLELRYTAEASRPFDVLVNGTKLASPIAGRVTGTWYPPGQTWFAETKVSLNEGLNTLRFESDSVYPHVDKFALVYSTAGDWPFDSDPPLSVTRIASRRGLKIEAVRQWQAFLDKVANNELPEQTAFLPWTALRGLSDGQIAAAAALLFSTDQAAHENSLTARVPASIPAAFAQAAPRSLAGVAAVYQGLVDRTDQEPQLAQQFAVDTSPLAGPSDLVPFYSVEEQERLERLTAERSQLEQSRPQPTSAMGVTESTAEDLRVHLRGNHITLGETVARGVPRVFASTQPTRIPESHSGRLELARWLGDKTHPLTSRVIANRVWHWHFGRGIVASVDNFGRLGEPPTHPRLLDWLAVELADANWSLKQLHRQIMLSSTYQMSATDNPVAAQSDPENKLLWRMNRRRLTAEEIRDSIIAQGTGLDCTMGGSLLTTRNHEYVTSTTKSGNSGEYNNSRRSVYLPVIRSAVYNVFQTLDFPDPAVLNGRRQTSTVAPQALLLMNSDLVADQTAHCAAELMAECDDDRQRISGAYRRILRRPATAREMETAVEFLARARSVAEAALNAIPDESGSAQRARETAVWQSFCRVLISTNEFVYIE